MFYFSHLLVAVRPLLPDPDGSGKFPRSTTEHNTSQQQQQQQILAYQHQHQQQLMAQQQQTRMQGQFPNTNFRGRPFQPPHTARNSLPIPMPMQQPGMTPLHNMNQPRGMPNFAAQALAQQQLLQQARARFIAQAQLMQQPQVPFVVCLFVCYEISEHRIVCYEISEHHVDFVPI